MWVDQLGYISDAVMIREIMGLRGKAPESSLAGRISRVDFYAQFVSLLHTFMRHRASAEDQLKRDLPV
ncbi:hypothetical protein PCCS19_15170 [Paenibacillus sp. CCS19]|nr:hypothetical protein PCCS19_15170 [Paenibacillus cellulosilyticus]